MPAMARPLPPPPGSGPGTTGRRRWTERRPAADDAPGDGSLAHDEEATSSCPAAHSVDRPAGLRARPLGNPPIPSSSPASLGTAAEHRSVHVRPAHHVDQSDLGHRRSSTPATRPPHRRADGDRRAGEHDRPSGDQRRSPTPGTARRLRFGLAAEHRVGHDCAVVRHRSTSTSEPPSPCRGAPEPMVPWRRRREVPSVPDGIMAAMAEPAHVLPGERCRVLDLGFAHGAGETPGRAR